MNVTRYRYEDAEEAEGDSEEFNLTSEAFLVRSNWRNVPKVMDVFGDESRVVRDLA